MATYTLFGTEAMLLCCIPDTMTGADYEAEMRRQLAQASLTLAEDVADADERERLADRNGLVERGQMWRAAGVTLTDDEPANRSAIAWTSGYGGSLSDPSAPMTTFRYAVRAA